MEDQSQPNLQKNTTLALAGIAQWTDRRLGTKQSLV